MRIARRFSISQTYSRKSTIANDDVSPTSAPAKHLTEVSRQELKIMQGFAFYCRALSTVLRALNRPNASGIIIVERLD